MNRRSTLSTRTVTAGSALLVFVLAILLLASSPPARAGIGNPIKKAKEKLAKKVESEESEVIDNDTVVFDDTVLELTDERLDDMLAAFRARKATDAKRAPIVERLNKANDERAKFWEKNGDAIMQVQGKRDELNVCYEDGYHEAQDRKTQEYAQNALTDPRIREKFARVAAEQNEAAARGDSAAIRKINETLFSETLISREDSLAIQKRCGPMPPPSAAEVKLAAMDKQIAADNEALRAIDSTDDQAKEAQMTPEQYGMARDRIMAYLAWKRQRPNDTPRGFSDVEIKALDKRRSDLRGWLG